MGVGISHRRRTRVAFVALVVGGVPALVAGLAGTANAAPVVPVAHLTLSSASATRLDADHCPLATRGRNFAVGGRLLADAVGAGVSGQSIEVSVDGRPVTVGRTDSSGNYTAAVAIDP